MSDCIFCKIITQEIPAEIVYEDDNVVAFLDINPIHKGHTLVIPKKHVQNIFDIDEEAVADLYQAARKTAHAVKAATGADGINLTNNNGAAAGQEVFHYHVHVIPRFEGDNFSHWPHTSYKNDEMREMAEKIHKSF